MPIIVRIENLVKEYSEGEKTRTILKGANALIEEGEFVAIRGRSGSGKSTLLNLLAGIDSPTSGDIYFATKSPASKLPASKSPATRSPAPELPGASSFVNLTRLRPHERTLFRRDNIGFIFQFFNLIPTLTVLENVLLPAELAGAPGANGAAKHALDLLDRVGLADRRDVFPDKLSGGEQQRVAIARALVQNPRLVLADEPTGNLDDTTGQAVMALLIDVTRKAGKTMVMVTHSRKMAALADRVLSIEAGKIVEMDAYSNPA